MSKLPDAVPCPDKPPLCLRGGYLCVAAPLEFREACFSVPALRALRRMRPQATLAVLCPESQQPLWKSVTELDGVIVYPDKASSRKIARILDDEDTRFESAIAWEAGEAAKAFARVEVLQRLGYPAAKLEKYLTDTVEVVLEPGPIQHRVRHYLNLVKAGRAVDQIHLRLGFASRPKFDNCFIFISHNIFSSLAFHMLKHGREQHHLNIADN